MTSRLALVRLVPGTPILVARAIALGAISIALLQFGYSVGDWLLPTSEALSDTWWFVLTGGFILALAGFAIWRGTPREIKALLQSGRWDLVLAFSWGAALASALTGYTRPLFAILIHRVPPVIIWSILSSLVVIGLLLFLGSLRASKNGVVTDGLFLSDAAVADPKEDLLGIAGRAEVFAKQVLNAGSRESMVFGLDAPWGIGKSTFINFCEAEWQKTSPGNVVVFKFSPLLFDDRAQISQVFVRGLAGTIRKHTYIPGIGRLLSRYSKLLSGSGEISLFGLSYSFSPDGYGVEEAFEDLSEALKRTKTRVLVIIDDLDRVSLSISKEILFVVKKSFALPNVSYVLCYDTSVLRGGSLSGDGSDVALFLEKFVNIKTNLFVPSAALEAYATRHLREAFAARKDVDPAIISAAMGGLGQIFASADYYRYAPILGDLRKLKRLVNLALHLDVGTIDFLRMDIDSYDLIHLLLIYIAHPDVFRRIVDTETEGRRFHFSAIGPYDDVSVTQTGDRESERETFRNSPDFHQYLKELSSDAAFLVRKVFDVSIRLPTDKIAELPEVVRRTYACFNGGLSGTTNLEEYLNLIVNVHRPALATQYKYFVALRAEVVGGRSLEEVLASPELKTARGEDAHQSLWRVIVKGASEFSREQSLAVVRTLIHRLPSHSFLESEPLGMGLRDSLPYLLVKFLDDAGWLAGEGGDLRSGPQRQAEIAQWVFGEGPFVGQGIVEQLSTNAGTALGLWDLLAFRLHCCVDRGGDTFTLTRSLIRHSEPGALVDGPQRELVVHEMRELSQVTFSVFKERYIGPRVDIIQLIDSLDLAAISGEWYQSVVEALDHGSMKQGDATAELAAARSRLKSFIVYQLASDRIDMGIGCGHYDEAGLADKKGIRTTVNEYLFGVCFALSSPVGGLQFLDYLLLCIDALDLRMSERGGPVASTDGITKALSPAHLCPYWLVNGPELRALAQEHPERIVNLGGAILSYGKYLPEIFGRLDELVARHSGRIPPV